MAKPPSRFKLPEEPKAWINGKGMCVFPFAANRLPDTADDFSAAMARGYRLALKLPNESPVVVATGGTYPIVDSLEIDVCDSVVLYPDKGARKPSSKYLAIHGLDAARFSLLGHRMAIEDATISLNMTATDARFLFTRDEKNKPLLVLGGAKEGRLSVEVACDDAERLLLTAARKGARTYGMSVSRVRLKMTTEGQRTVRVDLRIFARVGFVPAGLHFSARLDMNDRLDGTLTELSCTGDDILGPLVSGLIRPFLARYNGKTRPLMNFPASDLRLHDLHIDADQTVRITADFGR
jgi:hypothetical protein